VKLGCPFLVNRVFANSFVEHKMVVLPATVAHVLTSILLSGLPTQGTDA
jgi:hypothetical protein